jgi:hypothetical protein
MKQKFSLLPLIIILLVTLFAGCTKDTVTETYTFFRPVYKTKDEVKASAKSGPAVTVSNPGKLFIRDNFAFLSELDKGVHIIDFSNPAAPRNIAFITIPGCIDLAVRGNYLYADSYTDIVAIDITNPQSVVVKQFIEGVFPHRVYAGEFRADTSKVITDWVRVDTIVKRRMHEMSFMNRRVDVLVTSNFAQGGDVRGAGAKNGLGGSMARFGLLGDRLYTVSWNDLKVFNTADPANPFYVKTIPFAQGNIETIFPYKDKLFIGSQTGMFIYNAANPDNPSKLGQFVHARVCDPVIADDNFAFVTLRSNNICDGFLNQLDVVNIQAVSNPVLVKSYLLKNPAGLAKDGNTLLICDSEEGLKLFDASNVNNLVQLKQIKGMETYDVIALNGIAIVVAKDGLYFIDYLNPASASVIGKVGITK